MLTNVFHNINLTDMRMCYKLFVIEKMKDIPRLYETPISYSSRTYDEGKTINWKDGRSYLWCLLRYRVAD